MVLVQAEIKKLFVKTTKNSVIMKLSETDDLRIVAFIWKEAVSEFVSRSFIH